jgi:hypothetical protein
MIHYHGTPITPEASAAQILARRHAMVSFAHPDQIGLVADACQSFALDNGAFSAWRAGVPVADWTVFYEWVKLWQQHPGFDWFLIPDVIDGTEAANDALVSSSAWSPPEQTACPQPSVPHCVSIDRTALHQYSVRTKRLFW